MLQLPLATSVPTARRRWRTSRCRGIPGTTLSTDSYVAEMQTYLNLKGGVYRFGVNSDDGFKVSVARSPGDVNGLVLGSFNGGAAPRIPF